MNFQQKIITRRSKSENLMKIKKNDTIPLLLDTRQISMTLSFPCMFWLHPL